MVAEAQRRALVLKLYREMLWTAKFAYPAIVVWILFPPLFRRP